MSTVFYPPNPSTGIAGEFMSSASKPMTSPLMGATAAAANADQLDDSRREQARSIEDRSIETSGGWDAYEVWRRFIKDARARRERQEPN